MSKKEVKQTWIEQNLPGDLSGKTFVVTGGSKGIGRAAVEYLTGASARVITTSRSEENLAQYAGNELVTRMVLDQGDFNSIESFGTALEKLTRELGLQVDGILLNAGAIYKPGEKTVDGLPKTMGVNAIGTLALMLEILDRDIPLASGARVVTSTSSTRSNGEWGISDEAYEKRDQMKAYADSKLANALTAVLLNKKVFSSSNEKRAVTGDVGNGKSEVFKGTGLRMLELLMEVFAQDAKVAVGSVLAAMLWDQVPLDNPQTIVNPKNIFFGDPTVRELKVTSKDEDGIYALLEKTENLYGKKLK